MVCRTAFIALAFVQSFLLCALAAPARAQPLGDAAEKRFDWTMWGGSNSRMNNPPGRDIPTHWVVGERLSGTGQERKQGRKPLGSQNIKWAVMLGSETYGNPVVAGGKVFVGTNNGASYRARYPAEVDLGVLLCFQEDTGNFLWQHSNRKLVTGRAHDWPDQGVCSTPVVDGNRLWYVSNRGEVICLDTEGYYDDEDDGEPAVASTQGLDREEADVVWRFDMMKELGVLQHNMANCSMLSVDGVLFVCTSNGVDVTHNHIPAPQAPSFVAMERNSGQVVWTDNSPGRNILHAQWASPCYGVFDGQPQVIFPGGDGWLYSFDPKGDGNGQSKLLWKFDGNSKTAVYSSAGNATRCHFVAFPVIHEGLLYIAMGEDPEHGPGQGHLWCIDPGKRTDGSDVSPELAVDRAGNPLGPRRLQAVDPAHAERTIANSNSAAIWHYSRHDHNGDDQFDSFEETFHRSLSAPVIKDDVLYVADVDGFFHCLHAKTGRVYWVYDLMAGCWSSPLIVDDCVYIADEEGKITVFRHTADPQATKFPYPTKTNQFEFWKRKLKADGVLINEFHCKSSILTTPIVANDVLYVATRNALYAIEADKQ